MKVSNEVLAVLSRAEVFENTLTLMGQLDRKLYEQTNKVLDAAGGKWNKKSKCHIFDGDASERIEQIILTESIDIPKDEFEYFPTPPAVVNRMMELLDGVGYKSLEPSAGQGAIADAVRSRGADVDVVELNKQNAQILMDKGYLVINDDFLSVEPTEKYDSIAMNPPFSKQADIKHVMHAFKFLKSGSRLVSVMASSVTFRENKLTSDFRKFIEDNDGFIEPLPSGSFKSSGTMVNTVLVVLNKN